MSMNRSAAVAESTLPSSTFTSTERDIRLIETVRGYEVIYDPRCLGYKDTRVKENTWKIIAGQLAATPEDCRNRWRSLRDRFVREKKAMLLKRNEDGGANRRSKPWRLIEPMTFLWDFIMHRSRRVVRGDGTWSSALTDEQLVKLEGDEQLVKLEGGSDDGLVCEEEDASFEWISVSRDGEDDEEPQEERPSRKRTHEEEACSPVVTATSSLAEVGSRLVDQHEDEDSLFCKSVAHTLRRLAPRRKALAKLRVLQALYDAEFGTDVGPDVEVRLRPNDL